MQGRVITALARLAARDTAAHLVPTWHALLDSHTVTIHGDGFVVAYHTPDKLPYATVPVVWLQKMGGQAGKNGTATFGFADGRVTCRIKSTTYGVVPEVFTQDMPTWPSSPTGPRVTLSVADWQAGGAVASAEPYASTDECRKELYGVYLGAGVAATDSVKLAERVPAASMAAIGAVLPLPAVKAMLKLVAATGAAHLACQVHDGRVWFHGACDDGSTWTLTSPLESGFPDVARVANDLRDAELVEVNAADLREVWAPFKSNFTLAIFKDGGMVVWDDARPDAGIGTTLSRVPRVMEKPAVVIGGRTLPTVAKAIPKTGTIGIRAGRDGAPHMIAGQIVMPVRFEELPAFVHVTLMRALA